MVSEFEVMEYIRVFGPSTYSDFVDQFGPGVKWLLTRMCWKSMIKRYKQKAKKFGSNKYIYYFDLNDSSYNYLKVKNIESFIDGNNIIPKLEKATGRTYWRPWINQNKNSRGFL